MSERDPEYDLGGTGCCWRCGLEADLRDGTLRPAGGLDMECTDPGACTDRAGRRDNDDEGDL